MKRKLWIGLVLGLLLTLLCCGAASANDHGSCGNDLVWTYNSETKELYISGTGAMETFISRSDAPWYNYEGNIRSISISENVTSISNCAFYDCCNVTSITIPYKVTSIGLLAFANCTSLASVTILNPDAVIGDDDHDVFEGCQTSAVLYGWNGSTTEAYASATDMSFTGWAPSGTCGDNVTWSLSEDADVLTISGTGATWDYYDDYPGFYPARVAVRFITVNEGVTELGCYLFNHFDRAETITIPDSLTSIRAGAFSNCGAIESLKIPYTVTSIGSRAFYNCSKMIFAVIFNPSASFGQGVFDSCAPGFTIISYTGSTAQAYADRNGNHFNGWPVSGQCGNNVNWSFDIAEHRLSVTGEGDMRDYTNMTSPEWNPYREEIASIVIDSDVTSVGSYAFYDCGNLTAVTIPAGVTQIGSCAFSGTDLKSVTLPNSVKVIYDTAFYQCKDLKTVKIYNVKTNISDYVFYECASNLTIHGWPDSTAQTYAENNSITFKQLTVPDPDFFLPANLTEIESGAFAGIKAKAPVIPKTAIYCDGNSFAGSDVQVIYGYYNTVADHISTNYGYYFIPIDDAWMASHKP